MCLESRWHRWVAIKNVNVTEPDFGSLQAGSEDKLPRNEATGVRDRLQANHISDQESTA